MRIRVIWCKTEEGREKLQVRIRPFGSAQEPYPVVERSRNHPKAHYTITVSVTLLNPLP